MTTKNQPLMIIHYFFFSSRRRHTSSKRDWSSDVCSSDLVKKEFELRMEKIMKAYEDTGEKPEIQTTKNAFKIILPNVNRSEERRVGKECRFMWLQYHGKEKNERCR